MLKKIYIFLLFACLVFTCVFVDTSVNSVTVNSDAVLADANLKIIIDCGHGGEDGGAVSISGLEEKDINLQIGLTLEKLFLQSGFEVEMIRRTDTAIYDDTATSLKEKKISDIHNRSDICNNNPNNVYISIHQNKFEQSKYYGAQVFYSDNKPESKELAENIRVAIKELLQNDNDRQCKAATSSIYILNNAQVPAVLVECGFLSNEKEEKLLATEQYRNQIAFAIYCGFLEYYYQLY